MGVAPAWSRNPTGDNRRCVAIPAGIAAPDAALVLLSGGMVKSLLQLMMRRPVVMIGFGGYPSFPPLLTAALLRIPTMVHEQNAYLGRANRMLASRAGHLALSWQQTANLPKNVTCFTGGMPVRQAFLTSNQTTLPRVNHYISQFLVAASAPAFSPSCCRQRLPPCPPTSGHASA